MAKIIIGIQGGRGSTNEKAAMYYVQKFGLAEGHYEIKYLVTTKNVLCALIKGEINYGTYAVSSNGGNLVDETQKAFQKFDRNQFEVVADDKFQLDHALLYLAGQVINLKRIVNVYSHPHALLVHGEYLRRAFPHVNFVEEDDTALAAEKLGKNEYLPNSLVVAPIDCAELYNLEVYESNLPTNNGYLTSIHLARKR